MSIVHDMGNQCLRCTVCGAVEGLNRHELRRKPERLVEQQEEMQAKHAAKGQLQAPAQCRYRRVMFEAAQPEPAKDRPRRAA